MTDNSSIDISLTNLWRSWVAFRRGKKPSRAIIVFEAELEHNLLKLCADLNRGNYRHGTYNHKIVSEKKLRDIAVANVRDRVVHRLLYDYLVPIIDRRLDFDVWSCRKSKGLHLCLVRTQQLTSRYSDTWIWRADVKKFFDHVDHRVLKDCLMRVLSNETALSLLNEVIDSYGSVDIGQGIPIGNLTSQIFANLYLNEFDRFVRHDIKPLAYVRYGDDFVCFMNNYDQAINAQAVSSAWLFDKMRLEIHQKNNLIFKSKSGIYFLGHKIYPRLPMVVDKTMQAKIRRKVDLHNASSYKAMQLSRKYKKQIPWLMLDSLNAVNKN
jgi:RNA-directed DNA polymerase